MRLLSGELVAELEDGLVVGLVSPSIHPCMYGCLFVITGLSPGHLMLAPPAKHYGAAPNHHSTHGVGGGSHWQRLLVGGVVGGRVRGGH